jgi:c-di-GMP-binding flagellar brake protein YcgR
MSYTEERGGKMSVESQIPMQEMLNVGKSFLLPVGTRLQMEIGGIDIKLESSAVGLIPDDAIIIKYPVTGNLGSITHKLFKGNKVMIRYIYGGSVFAFQSEMLGSTSDPFRLIFIAYPSLIARHRLRKNSRVQCYLPAEMFLKNKNDRDIIPDIGYSGIVSDLSIQGCCFGMIRSSSNQTPPHIRIEGLVAVQIQLPGIETKIELVGAVRRSELDANKMNIGIQFKEIDEDIKNRIADHILAIEQFSFIE